MSLYFISYCFCGIVILPVISFTILLIISYLTPWPKRNKKFFFAERYHYNPSGVLKEKFPNLLISNTKSWKGPQHTKPSLYLSVIIPAMNEQKRLPIMLDECLEYLNERKENDKAFTFEIIVVDDGSKDNTADIAYEYSKNAPLFVCKLAKNIGKGGAVRVGMLCARGEVLLFADADGATTFSELKKLEKQLFIICNGEQSKSKVIDWTHPSIVVGSRAYLENEAIAKRSLFRTILMIGFHFIVKTFAVNDVQDTQCGFKLISRAAAAKLFSQMHIEKWAFDVELLYLAKLLNFSIAEVAVQWKEIDGSKVTPIISWIQMGRDILLIWFRYKFNIWRLDTIKS